MRKTFMQEYRSRKRKQKLLRVAKVVIGVSIFLSAFIAASVLESKNIQVNEATRATYKTIKNENLPLRIHKDDLSQDWLKWAYENGKKVEVLNY